jgi:hypothetical protein
MKNYQKLEIGHKEFFSNRLLKRTILGYGAIAAVCYIIFFLIMRSVNLLHVTELRFVNYAIFGFVGYFALKELRKHLNLNYFQDFGAAFLTGIVSFFFLAIFLYVYLHIDAGFSEYLTTHVINGMNSTPSEIAIILFFEGSAMSAIVTLCVMQYFKRFLDKE